MLSLLVWFAVPASSSALEELPIPDDGVYNAEFLIPLSKLEITIVGSQTDDPRATVRGTIPFMAPLFEVVNCPYTITTANQADTSLISLDQTILAAAIEVTNTRLESIPSAFRPTGKLVLENALNVVYFPNGKSGNESPSFWVTVTTDSPPGNRIYSRHAVLTE